jgi:hypothetical protein
MEFGLTAKSKLCIFLNRYKLHNSSWSRLSHVKQMAKFTINKIKLKEYKLGENDIGDEGLRLLISK